jgi:hypothetical protein
MHSEERERFLEVFSKWLTAWKRILLQNGVYSTVLESCWIRKCVQLRLCVGAGLCRDMILGSRY